MAVQAYRASFKKLSAEDLASWRKIPPAIASDCMNRSQTMAGRIKPLARGMTLCGQARTTTVMVGDNSAPHVLTTMMAPGEIIVIDAHDFDGTAVWGGIMTVAAVQKKLGGLVIDGAVRDISEICDSGFQAFCSSIVPAGPGKGFGGIIDGAISCGGCPVKPGDLILADDDGVAVVPLERCDEILAASLAKIAAEDDIIAQIKQGKLPAEQMGMGDPEWLEE